MCGRFVSTSAPDRIAAYFGAQLPTPVQVEADDLGQNYNVAPTHDIYAVVGARDGGNRVAAFHWGLIPSWAKDRKIASRMINARSETLAEKPAFRSLVRSKRCIVPMDGFYEWKPGVEGGPVNAKGKLLKQPVFVRRVDGAPLAVAGLWTAWKDPDDATGRFLHSATVITTAANDLMSSVHDRMPVLVAPEQWERWLDPGNDDVESLAPIFAAGDDEPLELFEVSTDVNNVRNNRPDLVEPTR